MNWKQGSKRLYLAMCPLWIVYVLFLYPSHLRSAGYKAALAFDQRKYKSCLARVEDQVSELEQPMGRAAQAFKTYKREECRETLTSDDDDSAGFWQDRYTFTLDDKVGMYSLIFLPPLVLFPLMKLIVWILTWIVRGFQPRPTPVSLDA